jgi:lysophospholipase L1-like esterase
MQSTRTINKTYKRLYSLAAIAAFCLTLSSLSLFAQTKSWVGTWACAPYSMGTNNSDLPPVIANNTVRQVIRVSIGGDTVRVKFSNKTCASAVTMKSVNIAVSPDGTKSPVTASTITPLKFKDSVSVTMNAGATATSDPVAFSLKPSDRIAITICYGSAGHGTDLTGHVASRTDSYVATGDQTANATLTGTVTVTAHWLHIIAMDVLADTVTTHAVACLGNSITDGLGLSGGLQNRWPDAFSVKLLANPATAHVGVLNLGIGGTNVTGGAQTCGSSRYQQDVLGQSGVKWVIILYGVNDINGGANATTITNAYKTMIADGHKNGMKVYGATLTPFKGHSYYSVAHEQVRQDVNKWIRTPNNFDGIVDFDKVVQDPNTPEQFLAKYKNDGLHPNIEGYKAMGESIDLTLFTIPTPAIISKDEKKSGYALGEVNISPINGKTEIAFEIPNEGYVSLKVYSMLGKEIAELAGKNFSSGKHTVEFGNKNLTKGEYMVSIKAGEFTASRKMILPVR